MLNIHIIPCLEDNYGYLVENTLTGNTILIDVPEAKPLEDALEKNNLNAKFVLFTHHDWDHIDGYADLTLKNLTVIGTKADAHRLPKLDIEIEKNTTIEVDGLRIDVIPADGHTIGQVAYYLPDHGILFSADSLMSWGCGRLSEGTYIEAFNTLECLAKLPASTLVYSGHNYGEMGGKFAISLKGDLGAMNKRMKKIKEQNKLGRPIVPITLSEEIQTNPFLKCHDDDYANELGIADLSPLERFTHIRQLRDQFKG